MIFLFTLDKQLFCFFDAKDVKNLQEGRTVFISPEQFKGQTFAGAIFGYGESDAAIRKMIQDAGHGALLAGAESPVAKPDQAVCEGCNGIMLKPQLLDGCCITCWKARYYGASTEEKEACLKIVKEADTRACIHAEDAMAEVEVLIAKRGQQGG
jgi:hypothetical protein